MSPVRTPPLVWPRRLESRIQPTQFCFRSERALAALLLHHMSTGLSVGLLSHVCQGRHLYFLLLGAAGARRCSTRANQFAANDADLWVQQSHLWGNAEPSRQRANLWRVEVGEGCGNTLWEPRSPSMTLCGAVAVRALSLPGAVACSVLAQILVGVCASLLISRAAVP